MNQLSLTVICVILQETWTLLHVSELFNGNI